MIDVHAHYVPEALLAGMAERPFLSGDGGMRARRRGDNWLVEVTWPSSSGPMRREFEIRPEHRDLTDRLLWMDAQGIRQQVISILPHLHGWYLPAETGAAYARAVNTALLAGCRQAPDRLLAMAHLPWQDPDAALAELEWAAQAGCRAVLVGSRIGSHWLDDPVHAPVLARIEALGLLLLLHPVDITQADGLREYYLVNLIGNPVDTTTAVARLIFSGTLDRHPNLRLCLSHGGGAVAALAGRWDQAYSVRPECRLPLQRPSAYLRRLYFDTVVHGDGQLRALARLAGYDRLLVGTDFPADMGESAPAQRLRALTQAGRARIAAADLISRHA